MRTFGGEVTSVWIVWLVLYKSTQTNLIFESLLLIKTQTKLPLVLKKKKIMKSNYYICSSKDVTRGFHDMWTLYGYCIWNNVLFVIIDAVTVQRSRDYD